MENNGKIDPPFIHITFNPVNGKVGFESNVPSAILFYGMLEMTREMYGKIAKEENPASKIQLAPPGLNLPPRRM